MRCPLCLIQLKRKEKNNTKLILDKMAGVLARPQRNFLLPSMEWFAASYFTDDASNLYILFRGKIRRRNISP